MPGDQNVGAVGSFLLTGIMGGQGAHGLGQDVVPAISGGLGDMGAEPGPPLPRELECPITLELMEDPVLLRQSGQVR